ncbi:deoxyuridine 5'-triphosphate nucleotidohydrolase-like [Hordeum vulgare subsp. vulgare]|uniref:deoxyuridine 5'-triphosphate nucleotidohydrolase-like n=1 Tax=Hordeum vulgare subsp. vulgare TaxID=112509 RepID=UPI001D1A3D4A|nr:deoxyuridine 5'-triphosphate nucleotidohydrolase-like [Hordeum vulgare subsp. vulgare]
MAPLLKVKKLSDKVILPSRGSALAVGSDFTAGYDLSSTVEMVVPTRGKALAATDLSISIPEGTYAHIALRSGLALKHSIDVGIGVIDANYRARGGIALFNLSEADFAVRPGDRVVQMIVHVIATPEVAEVKHLDATLRGDQEKRHQTDCFETDPWLLALSNAALTWYVPPPPPLQGLEVKVEYVPEKPNLGADDPLLLGVFEKLNSMSRIFFLVVETAR